MSDTLSLEKRAGEVFDEEKRLIGRYLWLKPKDQKLLDRFCQAWLDTYKFSEDFFLTIDLETTGLKQNEGDILLISVSWDGKHAIVFEPKDFDLSLFKEVLNTIPLNNQNIKFDLRWLIYHYKVEPKVYLDTMVACQLGWAGSFPISPQSTFGLDNIAKWLLDGYVLEKETRKQFIAMTLGDSFTTQQIEYAVKDALITHKLVWPIIKRLHNQGLWDIWEEIERPLIEILVQSELQGIKIDIEKLEELLILKEKELLETYQNITKEISKIPTELLPIFPKGTFNPGSSQQIVSLLAAVNIRVINTEKSTLQSAQAKHQHPLLHEIIEWRKTKSVISKFLTKWLKEHIDPTTNCIYTVFNTCGSETGRMSSKEPNMMQVPGDLRSMVIPRENFKILSIDFCYDEMTEVLTTEGWKFFKDLNKTELFYSLNPDTHEVEYVPAKDWIQEQYSGQMLQVSSPYVDLLTTPNHRHYVNDSWNKQRNSWKFLTSNEIQSSDSRISYKKNNSPIPGNFAHLLQLNHKGESLEVPAEDFLFLLGYWIADGAKRTGNLVWIYDGNKTNLENLAKRIEPFVGTCTIVRTLTCWRLSFKNKFLASLFRDYGTVWTKRLPEFIWQLDAELLTCLYEGLMLGDGTTKKTSNQYTTVSKSLADDFQRLLLHIGLCGSISYIERKPRMFPGGYTSKVQPAYVISINTYRQEPVVRIKSLENNFRTNAFQWTQYKGKIYCVTLERNHIIMVRRNGKQVWCGQSQYEFRAAAGATQEEYLINAFKDRERLYPEVLRIAEVYNREDPDGFVKEVTKDKISLQPEELKIVHDFAQTDIHKRNAALILNTPIDEVTDKQRSVGKCCALDTLVYTDKGLISLRDLLPKRLKADTYYPLKNVNVLTDEGYREAPEIYYNGKSEALQLITNTGRRIVCTAKHQFRTLNKGGKYVWVAAEKLREGSDLFVRMDAPYEGKQHKLLSDKTWDENLAFVELVGLTVSQGTKVSDDCMIFNGVHEERVRKLLVSSGFQRTKINGPTKKEEIVYVYRKELCNFTLDSIPKEILSNGHPAVIRCFLNGLKVPCNLGYHFLGSKELLRQVQHLLTRIGIPSRLAASTKGLCLVPVGRGQAMFHSFLKDETYVSSALRSVKLCASSTIHSKLLCLGTENTSQLSQTQLSLIDTLLTPEEKTTMEFLRKNNLYRETIVSITKVASIEVADLSVPSNNTVVYEGFVSHNTLGYAVLYGAGPSRIQESLAKEGFYYSLAECKAFLEKFFSFLPKVKELIEDAHAKVLNPGSISTVMGRKRFFVLPPKYRTIQYAKESESAFREATNFLFQGANADATKKAIVLIDRAFKQFPKEVRPIILLAVHDEIVIEVHESNAEEVRTISQKIMNECGAEAVARRVPIETSYTIGEHWSK